MVPAAAVPAFGGKGSSFSGYEQLVSLWPQVTTLEPAKGAAALILQMSDVARHACVTTGKDHVIYGDGVRRIMEISRDRCAPDAVDAIYQGIVRIMHYKRTDQTMDAFSVGFDVLRHKAEAIMATGGGFAGEFVLILLTQNASSPKNEKSLVLT